MDFLLIFSKILVISLLIVVGYFTRKYLVTDQGQRDVTQLLLYVFLPCTLIRAFNIPFDSIKFIDGTKITLIMLSIYFITTFISVFVSKFLSNSGSEKAVYTMAMVLPNVGFMGYPIIESLLGSEYIFYAVMANISFEAISWTLMTKITSTYLGSNEKVSIIKSLLTPPLIAIIFGLFIYVTPLDIPEPFISVINLLGNAMTPVAMIVVGMSLAKANLKKFLLQYKIYIVSIIRLLVFPAIVILLLKLMGFSGVKLTIPAILVSMPSAGYTNIIASRFGADDILAAEIITMCSILSLITIPFVISKI